MDGPYRSYNEIPCFSSIVPVTLGLATALTCKHVPKGVVRTTRSHRCHREPLLSLVNFIGILFFEQSGQLCVVCMIKKAADGITKWRVVRKWCWSVIIMCAELDTTNNTHNLGFGGRGSVNLTSNTSTSMGALTADLGRKVLRLETKCKEKKPYW